MSATVDDAAALRSVDSVRQRASNLAPALPAIGNILVASSQMSFRESRDPWGNPWATLTETTLLRRAARRTGGNPYRRDGKLKKAAANIMSSAKPLLDTGVLRNSVTFRIEGNSVLVGSNLKYAGTQQFGARKGAYGRTRRGGPVPWGNVPARAYLPVRSRGGAPDLPLPVRRQIVQVVAKHLLAR